MATQFHPLPFACSVLGLAPHRLMTRRRSLARTPASAQACLLEEIDRALQILHIHGRHSVFIVDAACGDGRLLLHAARRARALGFVAIDARGFDPTPAQIALATAAARGVRDPAIGFAFTLLPSDGDLPIGDGEADLVIDVSGAAERLLGDHGTLVRRR